MKRRTFLKAMGAAILAPVVTVKALLKPKPVYVNLGGDGVELFSSVHPNKSGGTWRNELSSPADLSEASLEQADIEFEIMDSDRGARARALAIAMRKTREKMIAGYLNNAFSHRVL